MQKTTKIYFVRHAEKERSPFRDPLLTEAGRKRAENLAEILKEKPISAIFSTGFKRTINTARPLSNILDLEIQKYDPRDPKVIHNLVAQNSGKTILIVGHQINLPSMINSLLEEEKVGVISEDKYDNLFLLEFSGESWTLTESRY